MSTNGDAACGAWTWEQRGRPASLVWRKLPMPVAGANEVLVRNRAVGLNPVDWKFIEWGPQIWQTGQVPGVDGAGEVVQTGVGVSREWLGERVAYHQWLGRAGSFAEYAVLPVRALMRIPPGLSYARAATLPCPALTAWQAIRKVAAEPGMNALVTGAGGAVGGLLVQLAVGRGWRVVAMSHRRHWARLGNFGVQSCVEPSAFDASSHERTFDAVFDTVSGEHAAALAGCITANGHLVCIQDRVAAPPLAPFTTAISLHEVALNAMHEYGTDAQWRRLVDAGEHIMADVLDGTLHTLAMHTGAMAQLPALLDGLRTHASVGRPVATLE
jgi:NADPH2:quinone reductase